MLLKSVVRKSSKLKIQLLIISILVEVCISSLVLAADLTISDFNPKSGSVGDIVTISGTNFAFRNLTSNTVKFNGVSAKVNNLLKTIQNTQQLIVSVPNGATTGPITVINSDGSNTYPTSFVVFTPGNGKIASSGIMPGPGDRKELDTYLSGFTVVDSSDTSIYYAPPQSILWVDTKEEKDGYLYVHFVNVPSDRPGAFSGQQAVSDKWEYKIEAAKLQNYPAKNRGIDYGLLVVPYKFHFSDQSLTGEATIGGYAGYQVSWPGIAITFPVISAGIGVVNTAPPGGTSTGNAPSFTVASGFIISLTKSGLFQIGVISGLDWAGKDSDYKHEGKPWLAVSFGTNFTNK